MPFRTSSLLFITGGLNSGGTENYLLRLCRFVRNTAEFQNIKIGIVYNEKYSALVPDFSSLNVQLFPFSGNPARSFNAVATILTKEHFNAVCTFCIPAFPALQQAKRCGVPVRAAFLRVRYRAGFLLSKKIPLSFLLDKGIIALEKFFLPKAATHLFSNSQTALEELCGIGKSDDKTAIERKVIRNGIEFPDRNEPFDSTALRQELGLPTGMKIVGHIAAFRPQKNHRLAVKAAETICSHRDDVCFVFFGEGAAKCVPPLIKRKQFADRIKAFEPRRDIFDVLRLLDVFILPSFSEGQSNALMEAMGMGVPFVVSNCSENREVLPVGFERFAVPPNDAEGFAQRIEEILDSGWTDGQRETVCRFAREMCNAERNFRQFLTEIIGGDD